MSRARGGFTVELKRPKRHLLNKPAAPKASLITEGALLLAEPRTDPRTKAGASSDHTARAMAERLFAPRTAEASRILRALTPVSDPHGGRDDVSPPETHDVTAASVETDEAEDAVTLSGAFGRVKVHIKRRTSRSLAKTDLPAGKRWMRRLPPVLQERAIPHWKRIRNARRSQRPSESR